MTYEKVFGKPGQRPDGYWQPWLGDHVGQRASDLGDLTPAQMVSAYKYVKQD